MRIRVKPLEEFFFEAARNTYAGGTKKETDPHLPKSKVYRFERGEYFYADTYFTNSEWSGGQTVIYMNGTPVWLMQYHGWCKDDDPKVLAFLKRVLLEAYQNGEFCGGRGPFRLVDENPNQEDKGLVYMNWLQMPPYDQGFAYFIGRERIFQHSNHTVDLFWHRYQGLLLGEPT